MDTVKELHQLHTAGPFADAAESKRTSGILARLAQRASAIANDDFYNECVRDLAQYYDVRYVSIGLFSDADRASIRSLACWADGGPSPQPLCYSLAGTPCQTVLDSRQLYVPEKVTALYPHTKLLPQLGVQSYFGVPLGEPHSDGPGLLTIMDDKPLDLSDDQQAVLRVFATRIAAELMWQQRPEYQSRMGLEHEVVELRKELGVAYSELNGLFDAVSHDLRAPLRAMSGFSDALLEDVGVALDEQALSYCRRIHNASRRLETQIDALTNLRRVSTNQLTLTPVDLSHMAHEVVDDIRGSEHYAHEVQCTIESGIRVTADRYLLKELLMELLDNAWQFTAEADAPSVQLFLEHRNDEDVLVVQDNGAGFDMRYAHKLFLLFNKLHADTEYTGQGVGLALAYRVVHRHGGQIWADSDPGKGARFYFTLGGGANR